MSAPFTEAPDLQGHPESRRRGPSSKPGAWLRSLGPFHSAPRPLLKRCPLLSNFYTHDLMEFLSCEASTISTLQVKKPVPRNRLAQGHV